MWEKIKLWMLDLGEFFYEFIGTEAGKAVKKYGPRAIEIVIEVAKMPGSGPEKLAKASELLIAEVPGMAWYIANTVIQDSYAIWMARQARLEAIDTDGDGVPDYRDMCKELGAPPGGCVTPEGCPDSDCDGVADRFDPCPNDPNCK